MQKYDTTSINTELKKALDNDKNDLEKSVNEMVAQFKAYEEEVIKISNLSALTDKEIERLKQSVEHFTKAFDLIKQILHSGGNSDEKITMLKKVVE